MKTMNAKHTPLPWKAQRVKSQKARHFFISSPGRWLDFAKVSISALTAQHEESLANAKLIAAAPELLASLVNLEKAATKFTIGCNCQTAGADDALSASLEEARAAIHKAQS